MNSSKKLKFKVGQKVCIKPNNFKYDGGIGEVAFIRDGYKGRKEYQVMLVNVGPITFWWFSEFELEKYSPKKHEEWAF